MNGKWKTAVFAVVFVAVLGAAYAAYAFLSTQYRNTTQLPTASSASSSLSVSTPAAGGASSQTSAVSSAAAVAAPDFTVYDANGKPVKLSDFRGKPVVLNFWASWCYYCKQEMPEFNQIYSEEKDNLQFLFVDWTDGDSETQQSGSAFIKKMGYSFPVYFDLDQDAVQAYQLTGIPYTFFIDKNGNLVNLIAGAADEATLKQDIASLKAG